MQKKRSRQLPPISPTWLISLSYRCHFSQLQSSDPEFKCIALSIWATDSKQSTDPFQTDMKSLVFLLVLTLCYLCRAQKHNGDNDNSLQAAGSREENTQINRPRAESEGGERELGLQSDVWVELLVLKEQVVEQKVLLQHLTTRITAAESRVEDLQNKNTGRLIKESLYGKK